MGELEAENDQGKRSSVVSFLWHYPISIIAITSSNRRKSSSSLDQLGLHLGSLAQNIFRDAQLPI